jgi:uncharacterized membrane protein YoaK (UPF0700 family)
VVPSRWTANLVNQAWRNPWQIGLTAAAAVLLFLVPGIVLPMREVRRRRRAASGGRLPVLLALLLVSAVGLMLLIGVAAALFAGMRRHFVIPLVGVQAEWAWVLVLPWLLLVLTAVAAASALIQRTRRADEPRGLLMWAPLVGAMLVLAIWISNVTWG